MTAATARNMSRIDRAFRILGGEAKLASTALWAWSIGVKHDGSVVLAQQATWATPEAQRLGVRLVETRDPNGSAAYTAQPGDLLFFTNSGTGYAAPNPKNSVVVINANNRVPSGFAGRRIKANPHR